METMGKVLIALLLAVVGIFALYYLKVRVTKVGMASVQGPMPPYPQQYYN